MSGRDTQGRFLKGRPPVDRFWSFVSKGSGCWNWTAFCSPYGRLRVGNENVGAHRFSFELHNGPIPDGMFVCHHCDNPRCVRPDHLYLGTALENNRDAAQRGRSSGYQTKGEANAVAKLTDSQVRMVKARLGRGERVSVIADEMGVPRTTLYNISHGRNWTHISPGPEA